MEKQQGGDSSPHSALANPVNGNSEKVLVTDAIDSPFDQGGAPALPMNMIGVSGAETDSLRSGSRNSVIEDIMAGYNFKDIAEIERMAEVLSIQFSRFPPKDRKKRIDELVRLWRVYPGSIKAAGGKSEKEREDLTLKLLAVQIVKVVQSQQEMMFHRRRSVRASPRAAMAKSNGTLLSPPISVSNQELTGEHSPPLPMMQPKGRLTW